MSRETLPTVSDRIPLGPFQVSPFCLGLSGSPEIVLAAFDAGVNFFFVTADMHWPAYRALREGLALLAKRPGVSRDDFVVASVAYTTQPEFNTMNFRELLDEIPGLGRIDVLVAGGAYGHELSARLPVYKRNLAHNYLGARAIGASFHDRVETAKQLNAGDIHVAYARYNSVHPGARTDLFPHIAQRKAPLYNFTTTFGWVSDERCDQLGLDPEMWRPSVPDHYRYALTNPEVDGLLIGCTDASHIRIMIDTLEEGPMDEDEIKHLELLARLDQGRSELVK